MTPGATPLVSLPVLLPLLAAGVSPVLSRRPAAQRLLTVLVLLAALGCAVGLLAVVAAGDTVVVAAGGWGARIGIALVADLLAALLLTVSVLVALAVLLFALGQGTGEDADTAPGPFHPAYLLLIAGIDLAFLSGDLFNLFVAFEVMLAASYVLITLNSGQARARAGMTYTLTSLTSSLLFLTALGLLYAATGTVGLSELAARTGALDPGVRTALSLLLLTVFGIKAAVVPLHFWLPDSYPIAPAPITAVFAALLTKVGIYAMVRTQTLLFPREDTWTVVAVAAVVTMLLGILGALAQDDVNRLLSFTLVSHVGFMLFGLSLFDAAGLAGSILYVVHHIIVQASLFLVAGLVIAVTGTSALHRMAEGGARGPAPRALAALFLLPALSLAGVPPFSGFVAKLALLRAAAAAGGAAGYVLAGAALLTSLLTLYAMLRLWRAVFWSDESVPRASGRARRPPPLTVAASAVMVLSGVTVAVCAGPLADAADRAAGELLRPEQYRAAVEGEETG